MFLPLTPGRSERTTRFGLLTARRDEVKTDS